MTRFGILGPLEMTAEGQSVAVGGPKQRALLAVLLLADAHPVSVDQLIEELWGDEPPTTAAAALQVYLSGLRKLLGPSLQRTAGGYRIDWTHGDLDAEEFTRLVTEARTAQEENPALAASRYTEALSLWRGADPDGPAPKDSGAVLDLVFRLVHRSLLVPDLHGPTGRYRMLETVQEYAAERLTARPMPGHSCWSRSGNATG